MLIQPDSAFVEHGIDLADAARYADCRAPFGRARSLPGDAYVSQTFQSLENEKVWTRDWVCVGTSPEIANPYDLLPYTVGEHAVHVQRQPNGLLAARFNKAQHGGCRSIPAQCRTGRKTHCSYGSCGHSRDRVVIPGGPDGELAPELGQYLGRMPERLLPVKLVAVGPFLFVNVDPGGDATPLPSFEWDERATRIGGEWREWRANWKLAAAALVDAFAEKGRAQWVFPNLTLLRARRRLAAIVQPVAMDRTLLRISVFSDDEVLDLGSPLARAAKAAEMRQAEAEAAGAQTWAEGSRAAWTFNQNLVDRLAHSHAAYWNAPLFRA